VRPAPGKEYSRCLMEFTATTGTVCSENELVIRKDDVKLYSDDYIKLTKDFYLGF
jgi:tRNA1(Val) A37 N6-methylase TrmN6